MTTEPLDQRVTELASILDSHTGRYERLRGVSDFGSYLAAPKGEHADEESLTEPVLAALLERVLGFPTDAYFPQLGKGGLKPDFTPDDLIAHPFVLDAKASDQDLRSHEPQIRRYIAQRSLDFGVLFSLRELRVYRGGAKGSDPELSFSLLPLWQLARGEALPGPELEAFLGFCERFSYRPLALAEKIGHIRSQRPWSVRLAAQEPVEVDVEFLVEQLRKLSRRLADDASVEIDQLEIFLRLNPGRREKLLDELRLLALDIEPGADLERLPGDPLDWRAAEGLPRRVWRQYLLRVAYLALTRILLYRAWEDVEFVKSYLFDGGFDIAYDELSQNVLEVLKEAFLHGADQYHWLFGSDNNYDWYRPREAALVEVLYLLAPVPLGKLDADVLGSLYVSYVDEIDRDRLGQFFTPRPVVRFMLDRAGFAGPDAFRVEGDERKPRRLLDFATGSGGFLVEAARRVIDEGGVDEHDPRGLEEALGAIVTGFVGGEISPFPYYLTEVNLLLQVSRLLGRLRLAGRMQPPFVLGVLHVDTLTAKSHHESSLEEFDPTLRADRAELTAAEGFDLVPLDGEKRERFRELLRRDGVFDVVVGNPPYVAEANNKPLFDRLRTIPAWKGIYKGKTDYLYYFLYLAVEKLAPGGRLCVITPAGWMNAGEADFLRAKLSSELRLDELYLFGSYKLFAADQGPAPTPTVESAILVATKGPAPEGHVLRIVLLEDELAWPDRRVLLDEMARRARGRPGRRDGIFVHDLPQAELRPEYPWTVKFGAEDVAARVVVHLQRLLDEPGEPVEPLAEGWKVFRGIETGADAYTRRMDRALGPEDRAKLQAARCALGEAVLELPPGSERVRPWSRYPEIQARSPESRAILYAALDNDDYSTLLRLISGSPPEDVLAALDRWRPLLAARAEIRRNPRRRWWETLWPRSEADLKAPKVIALYRTDRGRFALDEAGEWQPSNKATIVVGREAGAPVAYLCGLLNGELLDLWYAVRGKHPRDVWRNYEPKRMNEMPYRRPEGDPRAGRIAELVREIARNRRELLPHRAAVRDLGRTVKDPWKTGPVEVDEAGLLGELPADETVSVRTDPGLDVLGEPSGRAKRLDVRTLTFRRGGKETGRVGGDPARLDLLWRLLGGPVDDARSVTLPRDLERFEERKRERAELVVRLLAEGRRLVEEVERLVCALYEVPDELTEAVIEHAVARAGLGVRAGDE